LRARAPAALRSYYRARGDLRQPAGLLSAEQAVRELPRRQRPPEQRPLLQVAVERAQEGLLAAVLDPTRVDFQPERAGERADRLDDGLAVLAATDPAYQLGVELERGERVAAQARDG